MPRKLALRGVKAMLGRSAQNSADRSERFHHLVPMVLCNAGDITALAGFELELQLLNHLQKKVVHFEISSLS